MTAPIIPPSPALQASQAWHGVDHYENFPVGSWLLPRRLRPGVLAIYRFARYADDIADEGNADVGARLAALRRLHRALAAAKDSRGSGEGVVDQLAPHVVRHGLAWHHFHDLLDAFEQDLRVSRYADAAAVDDYCRRSANPVGRLMLELFGAAAPTNLAASDAICSALQKTNFLQDIIVDYRKNRIYLPQATLAACGVDERSLAADIERGSFSAEMRQAVAIEVRRAREQLLSGRGLIGKVPARLGLELRFIIAGALHILDRLQAIDNDVASIRPRLGWRDAPALLGKAVRLPHGSADAR